MVMWKRIRLTDDPSRILEWNIGVLGLLSSDYATSATKLLVGEYQGSLAMNCPRCGAGIESIGDHHGMCGECGQAVTDGS